MKSDKRILIAFILNAVFSIIEFVGGALTGSVAVISDAIHDLGDSISIGFSFILEKISKRPADETHNYGYLRYSVFGSFVTTIILLIGSILVIYNAVNRIINPVPINYNGMIVLAIFGAAINFAASYFTSGGNSLNQKAVSLHMLEDVLGWIVVLLGAILMKFTDFSYIDPIMSIGVAIFILINAYNNLKLIFDIFVEKVPKNIDIKCIFHDLSETEGIIDVHNLRIRSLDGFNNLATVHIVTDSNQSKIKKIVKDKLKKHGITYTTIEFEESDEKCLEQYSFSMNSHNGHCHHHHHH